MNDLEICKRIAEIEGMSNLLQYYHDCVDNVFNPLTDDALWVKLIEKYEVSISFVFCKVLINLNGVHERNFNDRLSLRRSAMLLIIRAHNER